MKKYIKFIAILVLFIIVLSLVGCANNSNAALQKNEPEIVQLSKDNYQKYIATYTRISISNAATGLSSTTYYYDFVGSNICKFNDAQIKYCLSNSSELPENPTYYTCELTLSGCGQSRPGVSLRGSGNFVLIIVEVSGTVEILY